MKGVIESLLTMTLLVSTILFLSKLFCGRFTKVQDLIFSCFCVFLKIITIAREIFLTPGYADLMYIGLKKITHQVSKVWSTVVLLFCWKLIFLFVIVNGRIEETTTILLDYITNFWVILNLRIINIVNSADKLRFLCLKTSYHETFDKLYDQ